MTTPDTPKDGDFASYLDARQRTPAKVRPEADADHSTQLDASPAQPRQTIQNVLVDGEEPTEEFLEEWSALENAPELSDEELAQQALNAPGEDGDIRTPE